jgi:glycerophosphoryl diester phosphodiesterase
MPELAPEIMFSPIISPKEQVGQDEAVALADEAAAVNGSIFAVNYKAITPALVQATHTANMLMEAWTVDDPAEMLRLADLGVDVIGSNDPRLAIETLWGS